MIPQPKPQPKQDILENIVPSKGVETQIGDGIDNQIQQAKKGDNKKKRQEKVNIKIQQAKKGDVAEKKQKLKRGINGKIQQQRLQRQWQKQQRQKQKRQEQQKKRQQQKDRQQQRRRRKIKDIQ